MSAKQLVGPYSQPEFRAPDQPQLSEPCHVGASKLGERSPCFPAAHLRKPLHRTSLHNMHHSVEYMEAQLEEGSRFRKKSPPEWHKLNLISPLDHPCLRPMFQALGT